MGKKQKKQILHFEWSPPWHWYIFLLANLLAFYLTYLLAFYLAFYLAYLLAFYLAFYLAYLLAYLLANLLAFYWHIFWHSIWHIFWHSIWHIFWHSIWHSIWHIFWHMFWHIFWHSIWQIFWHSIWHIFWHSIWHIFWHSIWHIFWHSIWHIFWHSIWHSIWHIFWHSIWPLRSGSAHWDLELVVEAWQCPLRPGSRGWGPAVPTAIWKSRLRSGSAHCNLEVPVEVRQCPLGSWARGGGPAVPTAIWTARRRRRRRWRRRMRRRRRRTALIKSNNPHLAGGEKSKRNAKKSKGNGPEGGSLPRKWAPLFPTRSLSALGWGLVQPPGLAWKHLCSSVHPQKSWYRSRDSYQTEAHVRCSLFAHIACEAIPWIGMCDMFCCPCLKGTCVCIPLIIMRSRNKTMNSFRQGEVPPLQAYCHWRHLQSVVLPGQISLAYLRLASWTVELLWISGGFRFTRPEWKVSLMHNHCLDFGLGNLKGKTNSSF